MRSIATVFVACFASFVFQESSIAQTSYNAGIVGSWEWSLPAGPSDGKATMTVVEKAGKLLASIVAPDGTKMDVADFRVVRDRVTFSLQRVVGPITVQIKHEGVIKGDEIRGKIAMKGGPMHKSGDWNAKRTSAKEATDSRSPDAIIPSELSGSTSKTEIGHWRWKLSYSPTEAPAQLLVRYDDGSYQAVVTAPDGSELTPTNFIWDGTGIQFRIQHQPNSELISMSYRGRVRPTQIVGDVTVAVGQDTQKEKWIAHRVSNE